MASAVAALASASAAVFWAASSCVLSAGACTTHCAAIKLIPKITRLTINHWFFFISILLIVLPRVYEIPYMRLTIHPFLIHVYLPSISVEREPDIQNEGIPGSNLIGDFEHFTD
jgi:hypothetical protein